MSILRPRFWQKVLAALLIVGVVPIALVSAISIQNTRNNLTTLGVTNIQQRSTSSASAIDAYLQSRLGDIIETDAGSVGEGAHGFLVDDYGIRLAVSETKGHRDQAESLIYKPIAPIEADTAKKLAADKRFGQKTPEQLVIDPLPTLKTALDALPKGASADATFAFGAGSAEQRGAVTRLVTKPWG